MCCVVICFRGNVIYVIPRVYNKERKNALYGPCNMCLESHMPGIQTLTNESTRFK